MTGIAILSSNNLTCNVAQKKYSNIRNISFSRSLKHVGLFSDQHAIHPTSSSALQSISCMQAVLHASIDAFPISNPANWSRATRCFIFEVESAISSTKNPSKYMDEPWMNTKTTAIFRKHDLINSGLVNNSWQFCKFPFTGKKHMSTTSRCTFLRMLWCPTVGLLLRRACSNYQGCHLRELMMIFYPRQNG